jgi:lactoylglutathione lyase
VPSDDSAPAAFNHVGLCVRDLAIARRFYEDLLGFVFLRSLSVPDSPTDRLLRLSAPLGVTAVYLQRDGFVLELLSYEARAIAPARVRPMDEPGLTHVSLSVRDLPGVLARVPAFGGEVLADTDIGVAAFVRDPDGQLVELLAGKD